MEKYQLGDLDWSEINTLEDALNHYKRFMKAFGDDFNLCDNFGAIEAEEAEKLLMKVRQVMYSPSPKRVGNDDGDLPF